MLAGHSLAGASTNEGGVTVVWKTRSVPFASLPFKVMAYEAPALQLIGCFNVSTPPTLLAVSVPNVGRPLGTKFQLAPPPVDSASKPPFPAAKS